MRLLLTALSITLAAHAAAVEGIVLDDESGNPLARAQVGLMPLPGTDARYITIKASDHGTFKIPDVRPGWYILRTSFRGFADTEAGQLRAGRPGAPFEVAAAPGSLFFQMRMRRMAAIGGSVADENNAGIPDWPVYIYTARKPVRRVAQGTTDDRGYFRIGLLDPGTYLVRSGGGLLEDGTSLLPVEAAAPVRVHVGETQQDVAIRVVKGRLAQLNGVFTSNVAAKLTLVTETGRKVIASIAPPAIQSRFAVAGVPPGPVELIAEGAGCGSYRRIVLDRAPGGAYVACNALLPVAADWAPMLARRVDLDGPGPSQAMRAEESLIPGHWEFLAQTDNGHYVASMQQTGVAPTVENEGWFGFDIERPARIHVTVSSRPASVAGVVSMGGKPVPGAPVYLEKVDPERLGSRLRLWTARADAEGHYRFGGLAPGSYRLLGSFDYDSEDRFPVDAAHTIALSEGDNIALALAMALP